MIKMYVQIGLDPERIGTEGAWEVSAAAGSYVGTGPTLEAAAKNFEATVLANLSTITRISEECREASLNRPSDY